MKKRVFLLACFLSFVQLQARTKEEDFWLWFKKSEDMLYGFENDQERIFDSLSYRLSLVNPSLTFEFGPVQSGKRELVLSAAGNREAFPKVESQHKTAPKLKKWVFTKFRPRRSPLTDVSLGGITVKVDDVRYFMLKDEDPKKVAIVLYIKNYSEVNSDPYRHAGYLMLDQALGEYDMETRVGGIEMVSGSDPDFKNAYPLAQLADHFDEAISRK